MTTKPNDAVSHLGLPKGIPGASDLDSYADFAMSVVRRLPGIKEMQSMFVLKEIKPLVSYPLKNISG